MRSGLLAAKFLASYYDHAKVPSDTRPAIAVAGRSNVGKSTLINAITEGKNIARVSATPGKTQSLNFFLVEDRFYLVDLPGYGYAKVPERVKKDWGRLVEAYLTTNPALRGLVLLLDCRRQFQPDDLAMTEWISHRGLPCLIVVTKADKLARSHLTEAIRRINKDLFGDENAGAAIPFSAKSALGRKEVLSWIRRVAV